MAGTQYLAQRATEMLQRRLQQQADFVGREGQQEALDRVNFNPAGPFEVYIPLLIIGRSGAGKTAPMAKLADSIARAVAARSRQAGALVQVIQHPDWPVIRSLRHESRQCHGFSPGAYLSPSTYVSIPWLICLFIHGYNDVCGAFRPSV
jgi:hypothetical protein